MDIETLRVTFSLVALCLLVLFYVTTYRVTHAPFCGWWCVSLVLFLGAAVAWLLDDTSLQVVANPLGNVLGVSGAATVWLAARSLEEPRPPWRLLVIVPALTAVAAALNHPGTNIWSGGLVFLAAMTFNFGLATRQMWRIWRRSHDTRPTYSPVTATLTVTSAVVTVFYLARTIVYAVVGPHHAAFTDLLGTTPTTLLTTVMLVAVSHSMGALSQEQLVQDLRRRAERDDLTGMLHRDAFWSLAEETLRGISRAAVIVADLDHFKQINDLHGHILGDEVIRSFADATRYAIRSTDLAARFGGEEFVILMPGASTGAAEVAAGAIARRLRDAALLPGGQPVTVSYGIAAVEGPVDLETALEFADTALYEAKQRGRDRTIIHTES